MVKYEDKVTLETNSNRGREWLKFSKEVLNHIDNYTVPQYGDLNLEDIFKGDQMQYSSSDDIKMNLLRYVNRINSNARGSVEALRDLKKISHYSCILWSKYDRDELKMDEDDSVITIKNIKELDDFYNKIKIQGNFEKLEISVKK